MIQGFYTGDFFSRILEIEYMYEIKKKVLNDELPGWCWTLMDSEKLVLVS